MGDAQGTQQQRFTLFAQQLLGLAEPAGTAGRQNHCVQRSHAAVGMLKG
jgi:hypothetical protein